MWPRGVAYDDGRTGALVQARLGGRADGKTGKPTAQIKPKSRVLVILKLDREFGRVKVRSQTQRVQCELRTFRC